MTGEVKIFSCTAGMGEPVTGVVLSANDDFSARYDLDRINGVFFTSCTRTLWTELRRKDTCTEHRKRWGSQFVDVAGYGLPRNGACRFDIEQRESDHGSGCGVCESAAHAWV